MITIFNKKAQSELSEKVIFWVIMMVLVTFLIIFFTFIIQGYKTNLYSMPDELKAQAIVLRFTDNPSCFAYQDEFTEEVYTGVIDLEKFTDEIVGKCYDPGDTDSISYLNFGFELPNQKLSAKTKQYYDFAHFTFHKVVFIKNETDIVPGQLKVYVSKGARDLSRLSS